LIHMACCSKSDEEERAEFKAEMENTSGGFILAKTRCLTDFPMLIVFICYMIGMGVVFKTGYDAGEIERIKYGTNWKGGACGAGDNEDYKRQYWPNVLFYKQLGSVCLDACPDPSYSDSWTDFASTSSDATYDIVCICNGLAGYGNPNCGNTAGESSDYCTTNSYTTVNDTITNVVNPGTVDSTITYDWNTNMKFGEYCNTEDSKKTRYFRKTLTFSNATTTSNVATVGGETDSNFWYKYTPLATNDQCYWDDVAGTMSTTCLGTWRNEFYSGLSPPMGYKMNVPLCHPTFRTKQVMNRCIPWLSIETMRSMFCSDPNDCPGDSLADEFSSIGAFFEEAFADIADAWYVIVASVGISILIGFLYLFFMEKCAKCMIMLGLGLVIVGLAACTFAFYKEYNKLNDRTEIIPELATKDEDVRNRDICMGFGITFGILLAIVVCVVICFAKQINVAGALLQCAADAILDMPGLIIYPVWSVLVFILITVMFIYGALYLSSSGTDSYDPTYGFHTLEYDEQKQKMFVIWIFGYLWMAEFMSSVGFMVVAFCFALWFFAPVKRNKEEEDYTPRDGERELATWPIMIGVRLTLCHHLGTVAFGSLIIAIIQMARIALEYIEQQKKQMEASGAVDNEIVNKIWTFIFCCLRCCLWCLEKCMKALNKIAYIATVMNGTWFCSSACHAMGLLILNISWFAVITGISCCMLLFGKFACALITAALCGWWCTYLDLSSILFPTICCFIIGYFIAALFAEVYEMGVDCMLVCFLEVKDLEVDGDAVCVPPQLEDQVSMAMEKASRKAAELADRADREKAANDARAAYDDKKSGNAAGVGVEGNAAPPAMGNDEGKDDIPPPTA